MVDAIEPIDGAELAKRVHVSKTITSDFGFPSGRLGPTCAIGVHISIARDHVSGASDWSSRAHL